MKCTFETIAEGEVRCRLCGKRLRFAGDPARLVAKCPKSQPTSSVPTGCIHRGLTMRAIPCGTCPGKTKVFACSVHGECTIAPAVPEVHACRGCADHAPAQG